MQNWEAGRQCCSAAHFCEIVFAKQDYIPPCQRRNAECRREALQHNVWQLIKLDEKERNQETEHIGVLWRNRYLCWVRAIYWNTEQLGRAVQERELAGLATPLDLLRHISPLSWAHILLTGEYLWRTMAASRA